MSEFEQWAQQREAAALSPKESLARQQARFMANFCLVTGVQPSEYKALTMTEVAAFIEEYERMNKE